jgi:hypothetical protein
MDDDYNNRIVLTPRAAILPVGTQYMVQVAPDGATTVTTFNGTVIVMDLISREGVVVETNHKVTLPNSSTGLGEQELQQLITEADPESADQWLTIGSDTQDEEKSSRLPMILLMVS